VALRGLPGPKVFGFEFPYELPERDEDGICGVSEEVECAGLEWIEERGLRAREYTQRLFIHGSLSRLKMWSYRGGSSSDRERYEDQSGTI
tara:strand:+ start:249 stop:518 length:270 start_codon:yes stop_codon:yes gene_type:complete